MKGKPIELTNRQYMDAISKLPHPEYMRKEPPVPGMIYRISILAEDIPNSANSMVMGKDEGNLNFYSIAIELEFQLVFCRSIVPYWQPRQPILIVPGREADWSVNLHAAQNPA